jgi:hypothetical protein
MLNVVKYIACVLLVGAILIALSGESAFAQSSKKPPKNGFEAVGVATPDTVFNKGYVTRSFFSGEVVSVSEEEVQAKEKADQELIDAVTKEAAAKKQKEEAEKAAIEAAQKEAEAKELEEQRLARERILGRVDRDAPKAFQDMVFYNRTGDTEGAKQAAGEYVDYLVNLMFEVRSYAKMIGEALIEKKQIEEDDWIGVEQYLDQTFASVRAENSSAIKPTHSEAMKRIAADTKGQAEVYFFFTLSCSWCRNMAPDVERLWRVVKSDKNVKMVALTIGESPSDWIKEYRKYTGLSLPIYDGTNLARSFDIGFVPAVVVVSPTQNKAYLKTGEQSFDRMYEFVRTVQGLPVSATPVIQQVLRTPIGQIELADKKAGKFLAHSAASQFAVSNQGTELGFNQVKAIQKAEPVTMERF